MYADLRRAFTLAAEFADMRDYPFVVLNASPSQLTCYTRGPEGCALETTLAADVSGAPARTARTVLSKELLLPLLAAADGMLELAWEEPTKPVLMREITAPPCDCWVIMPGNPAPKSPAS